jgi:chromate transporter
MDAEGREDAPPDDAARRRLLPLRIIAAEWGRIGITGFGGPPAHLALFRRLCVERNGWLADAEYEDAIASANLLPGPASTQVAIFCAWRLRGVLGGLVGGVCFILPGLILILALAVLFLAEHAPLLVVGAAAGAGAAVPVIAVQAAAQLAPPSWRRIGIARAQRLRWALYALLGAGSAALLGPYLVLVIVACGLAEMTLRGRDRPASTAAAVVATGAPLVAVGGLAALAWTAFKVGALSYGGGFVIIPLMQADAVSVHHWMTAGQFLSAVALGQITPGPVVQTVAVVGYAAAGLAGGLLAAVVAFAPSFVFVLGGARHFDRLRQNARARAFLTGAGPAAIGAIAGSAIPLGLSLSHIWQAGLLAVAAAWLFGLRRGVVSTLLLALVAGAVLAALGLPVSGS